ncbi:hypothetical protein RCL_jg9584.t1 [Rhizophagus clarus]|uniref:Uncharacterized protein n=1 Tax=Rhizophagus clarus TaxID=94130 RepID=A0A8H3M242_9GLOM|nr:hypothetical protein RCL_jg9584.t1 [Rhizophagus clarus]
MIGRNDKNSTSRTYAWDIIILKDGYIIHGICCNRRGKTYKRYSELIRRKIIIAVVVILLYFIEMIF